jgi:dolichol kinase
LNDLISIFERISATDWITTFAALIIIFILLFIFELGSRKFGLKKSHSRKAVHIIVGLLICLAAYVLTSNIPILILAFLFVLFDWWAIRTQHFTSIHPHSQSLGTVFYPLAVFLLALLLWYENKHIFIIATLIMVIPDALAAIVGETYSRKYIILLREKKSLLGAGTMFISTQLLVFIAIYFFLHKTMLDSLVISIMIALLAAASELLSIRGSDNLSVPLISAFFLHAYLNISATEQLTIGILLSTILGILSYRFKFLKIDGAILAFILGSIIFGFGGISYAIPILAFFIFSSLLSSAGKNKKKLYESLYAKTSCIYLNQKTYIQSIWLPSQLQRQIPGPPNWVFFP